MPASPPRRAPTALFLSPHLDDVAFSCGGAAAALHADGWRVVVATVFTASVANPTGFALACQLDKGLSADVDYLALRRDEDRGFGAAVRADRLVWLGLREAPHRGYASAADLFAGVRPDDDLRVALAGAIDPLVVEVRPDLILGPQAVGGHADHRQLAAFLADRTEWHDRLAWYRDLPYAEKHPDARPDPVLPAGLVEVPLRLDEAELERKLDGCAAYITQVPFQFGDADAMRRRLAAFAAAEAARLGMPGHAETFLVPARVPFPATAG